MRFILIRKSESLSHYTLIIGNSKDEIRYGLSQAAVIRITKMPVFNDSKTPEIGNKRWFESLLVGSEFKIEPGGQ